MKALQSDTILAMKLYHLRLIAAYQVDPGLYDLFTDVVVRAQDEWTAREMADDMDPNGSGQHGVWMNGLLTSCEELVADGEPGVILQVYRAA